MSLDATLKDSIFLTFVNRKLRPLNPVVTHDDDGSMSSGDESDNDDLTEPDQSETEPATSPGTSVEALFRARFFLTP